jgi:glycosyltransferase involved in cell wall biosynthesis
MHVHPSHFGLISLVVPLYNEAQNVIPLVKAINRALKDYTFELILVNDGSTDDTQQQLKQQLQSNCIAIELDKNYGQSLALAAGIDHAKGDYIVTMDGDLQNDPNDIPIMLNTAKDEHWDIVGGIRVNRKDPFHKTLPSKIANYIIRKSTKLNINDHGCSLKVFTKTTAKKLNLYGGMHRFINVLAHLNGARITQLAVHHNARKLGVSKYGLGRTFKVINDLIVLLTLQNSKKKSLTVFGRWILSKYNLSQNKTLYRIKNISVFEK